MDGQQWVKELRHRVNEANGEYYDVIELDFDEVDEIIEIIEKTYKPECELAELRNKGKMTYGRSQNVLRCKTRNSD